MKHGRKSYVDGDDFNDSSNESVILSLKAQKIAERNAAKRNKLRNSGHSAGSISSTIKFKTEQVGQTVQQT